MLRRQRGFLGLEGLALNLVLGLAAALAASLVASGAALWYLDGKVDAANEKARQAAEDYAAEKEARGQWQAAAGTCSAGTRELERQAKAAEEKYRQSQAGKAEAEKKLEDYVNGLLTAERPAGLDECQATRKELDDEIDRRHPL